MPEESTSSLCGCRMHMLQEGPVVLFHLWLDLDFEQCWLSGVRLSWALVVVAQRLLGCYRIDCGEMSRRREEGIVCHRE